MLLEKLKLKQGQLSDYQFANKLGISHQLWQMTRTAKREIGLVILKAILKAYPELDRDVLLFLRGDVVTSSTADLSTTPSETPYKLFLAGFWRFCGAAYHRFKNWFCYLKAKTKLDDKKS